jgi:hypothetical protein
MFLLQCRDRTACNAGAGGGFSYKLQLHAFRGTPSTHSGSELCDADVAVASASDHRAASHRDTLHTRCQGRQLDDGRRSLPKE